MANFIFLTPRIQDNKSYVNLTYYDLFIQNDMIPIILPFTLDKEKLKQIMQLGKGLIICGGIDINPYYYHKHFSKADYNPALDAYDFFILNLALELNIPILGICRGIQLINVYFHGTLFEDIQQHQNTQHEIFFENTDNTLFSTFGQVEIVNSYHHQAIDKLGHQLICLARSKDGLIEAIKVKDQNVYAIQWHPELMLNNEKQKEFIFNFFHLCKIKKA